MAVPPLPSLDVAVGDLAYTDDLTGLFNQRLLNALLDHLWPKLIADHDRLALMMIDLDRFKEVNDTYGHLAGDEVLRTTAGILRRHFRADDVIVRYGGDEFVVVMPGAGGTEAGRLGERAREALSAWSFDDGGAAHRVDVPLSFSIGVASYPDDGQTGNQLLREADLRLLEDKRERQGVGWTKAGPRPQVALRTLLLGGGLILTLALTAILVVANRQPAPALLAIPPQREAALKARILSLQQQLARLATEAERLPDAQREDLLRRQVGDLTETIRQLEGQLEAAPLAAQVTVAPAPTSTPTAPLAAAPAPSPAREAARHPATALAPPDLPLAPVDVPPTLLSAVQPAYPPVALRLRRETLVELRVVVDASGQVVRVEPVGHPAGLGFDQAAREAAVAARFRPGTHNGIPVEMETSVVVRFRLDQQR